MFWLIFGIVVTFMVGVSIGILIERNRMDAYLQYLIDNNDELTATIQHLLKQGGERGN